MRRRRVAHAPGLKHVVSMNEQFITVEGSHGVVQSQDWHSWCCERHA